jgi:hypothetical protein
MCVGKRPEEHVDGRATVLALCHLRQPQCPVSDLEPPVGRDDINVVRFEANRMCHLCYRDRGSGLQNFSKLAVVIGREVQNHDIGGADARGDIGKKGPQRFDATC